MGEVGAVSDMSVIYNYLGTDLTVAQCAHLHIDDV